MINILFAFSSFSLLSASICCLYLEYYFFRHTGKLKKEFLLSALKKGFLMVFVLQFWRKVIKLLELGWKGRESCWSQEQASSGCLFPDANINLYCIFQSAEDTIAAETATAHGIGLPDVLEREHYLRFRTLKRFGKIWQSRFVEFKCNKRDFLKSGLSI